MLLPRVIHNCKIIFTSTIVHESRYRISFYSVQSNNSQATVDPQFYRSKYKFNNISNVHSSNVIIISNVYSLNEKVKLSDVYSLNAKVKMSNEPWALALRCATIDKGYSMLIGCQHWGSALGVLMIGCALRHHSGYCVRVSPNHLRQLGWVVPWGYQ